MIKNTNLQAIVSACPEFDKKLGVSNAAIIRSMSVFLRITIVYTTNVSLDKGDLLSKLALRCLVF
jgi:hypothetical protein